MDEFKEKIVNLLKERGFTHVVPENVAVYTDNISDKAIIGYNFMSTNIALPKDSVSKEKVLEAGFKWWPTWIYNAK